MNLDGVRERSRKCEVARDAAPDFISDAWALAAIASAADVPALIAEIERLRADLNVRTGQLKAARRHTEEARAELVKVTQDRDDWRNEYRRLTDERTQYVPIPPQEHGAC